MLHFTKEIVDFGRKRESESFFESVFIFSGRIEKRKDYFLLSKKRLWNQKIFFESILFFGIQPIVRAEKKEKINFDTACNSRYTSDGTERNSSST